MKMKINNNIKTNKLEIKSKKNKMQKLKNKNK